MSISSSTRKAGPYACNGATVAFPFAFKVFTTADVRVVLTDTSAVESDLALGANYTVALNADQDANPGGTVTTTAAYGTGYLVTLSSQVQNLQPVTLTNQGGFYPKIINDALDRLTILVQQLAEKAGRTLALPISANGNGSLPPPIPNGFVGWDALGQNLVNYAGIASAAVSSFMTTVLTAANAAAARAAIGAGTGDANKSDIQLQAATAFTAAGVSGTQTVTTSPLYGNLASGERMRIKFAFASTGADTLNRDGKGAKNLKQYDSTGAKIAAVFVAGQLADIEYDGTDYVVLDPLPPTVSSSASIVGTFRNLQASAGGTGANVSISYDEIVLEDGSNNYVTARSGALTINSAGSGANGLDTGTLAASTWYALFVIRKPDGTTAGLISLSATAPTMPSGYTFKARIGWIRTDGSGNKYPLAFKQYGRRVKYAVSAGSNVTGLPQMSSGLLGSPATPTWSAVSVSPFVPPSAASISVLAYTSGSGAYGIVAPSNSYGGFNGSSVNSATNPPPLIATSSAGSIYGAPNSELVLESTSIYVASSGGGGMYVHCGGWEDNL